MTSVIITGGGTAGHTNPGIAAAQALVARGLSVGQIHFIGGERGNEGTLVREAGFTIDLLPGRGIRRSFSLSNVRSVLDLLRGVVRAFGLVRRHDPDVVLCLGGYAAFGASLAALVLRIPVVVTEQNARASAVNRLVGRFAKACALPFPDTDLPKGVLTGNPVLPSVVEAVQAADRDSARATLQVDPSAVMVAVWTGSLGSTRVNTAVRDLALRWKDRAGITLHHVIGERDWERFGPTPAELDAAALTYRTVRYETRMPEVLVAADLAICRSGASTVTELAIAGLPSVLIPLPGAPRDHQTANSRELVEAGGAILLSDADVSGEQLERRLLAVVEGPATRTRMAAAAASVGRPGAARAVADLVIEIGNLSATDPTSGGER